MCIVLKVVVFVVTYTIAIGVSPFIGVVGEGIYVSAHTIAIDVIVWVVGAGIAVVANTIAIRVSPFIGIVGEGIYDICIPIAITVRREKTDGVDATRINPHKDRATSRDIALAGVISTPRDGRAVCSKADGVLSARINMRKGLTSRNVALVLVVPSPCNSRAVCS